MKTILILTVVTCVSVLSLSQAYGEDNEKSKAEQTQTAAPAPVPGPGSVTGPSPTVEASPVFAADKQQMFQPVAIDPALVRQSMQARSEYDDLNRRIMARQSKLYEENATIKDLQAKLRDLQKKIDKLMAEDEELTALKKKYEAITPEIPMGSRKGFGTNAMSFPPNR